MPRGKSSLTYTKSDFVKLEPNLVAIKGTNISFKISDLQRLPGKSRQYAVPNTNIAVSRRFYQELIDRPLPKKSQLPYYRTRKKLKLDEGSAWIFKFYTPGGKLTQHRWDVNYINLQRLIISFPKRWMLQVHCKANTYGAVQENLEPEDWPWFMYMSQSQDIPGDLENFGMDNILDFLGSDAVASTGVKPYNLTVPGFYEIHVFGYDMAKRSAQIRKAQGATSPRLLQDITDKKNTI